MKKNAIYLIIFLVLGGLAAFLLLRDTSPKTWNDFAFEQTEQITSIKLTSRSGETAELTNAGTHWMINNKYEARKSSINTLMETIERVVPMRPVSDQGMETVVSQVMAHGIKVEIFTNNPKRPRSTTLAVRHRTAKERT